MAIALITALSIPAAASAAANSCPQWEPLLRKHFPATVVPTLSRIMYRESRCNPKSVSQTRRSTGRPDVGLMQIQGSWQTVTQAVCKTTDVILALQDPSCNVRVARYLFDNGGLRHWKATSGQ